MPDLAQTRARSTVWMPGWRGRIAAEQEEAWPRIQTARCQSGQTTNSLEAYRSLTANLLDRAGQDTPDKSAITEEILRRGLSLPDVPTVPKSETVDWNGEAGRRRSRLWCSPETFLTIVACLASSRPGAVSWPRDMARSSLNPGWRCRFRISTHLFLLSRP